MRNTTQTCIAGEYYVLAELARRGAIASMTIRNTKGVDILAASPDGKKMFKIEVKTCTNKLVRARIHHGEEKCIEWQMGEKHEGIKDSNLVYAFVWLPPFFSEHPRIFVVSSEEVAHYVASQHNHWLKASRGKNTNRRSFRIPENALGEYENNWESVGITT